MEFQAYPAAAGAAQEAMRSLLRLQKSFRGTDSIVLPTTMLFLGASLLAYQYFTDVHNELSAARIFLTKLLVSMAPLVILELQVPKCVDPVGLFAKFSTKVMLMHVLFLALRSVPTFMYDSETDVHRFDWTMLVIACVLLPTVFGFRPTPRGIWEHLGVFLLAFACMLMAILELAVMEPQIFQATFLNYRRVRLIKAILFTSADFVEILAFVPAVWMALRRGGQATEQGASNVFLGQKRAFTMSVFIIAFHGVEDIIQAVALWNASMYLVMLGHMSHYLLILDFAGFLLAQLCDPKKLHALKTTFMNRITDAIMAV